MKNLKRALSLVLSTAMLLGMMVMGTSAASDTAGHDCEEAIELVKLIGVMEGDEKGNFNPDKVVTRNEMAVIMSNLMDLKLNGSHPFTDVPTWADKYVAAVYTNGYSAGTSATTFGGAENVTTAQAALMIMKTLGYFEFQGEFGNDWQLATVKRATELELFEDIDAAVTEGLTRGEVAQMIVNALDVTLVIMNEEGGMKVEGNGISVTQTGKYEPTYRYGKTLLTEQFEDLVVDEDAEDAFGRPAVKYTYDEDDATVSKKPLAVYAGADFDEDTIEDDFEDWTVNYDVMYNGGYDANVTKAAMEASRNGWTIEVYGDKDEEIIEKFIVTEATAAIVDAVNTDDDDEITDIVITVLSPAGEETLTIDAEDDEDAFALVADLEEDEVFAITLKGDWDVEGAEMDDVILAVDEMKTVEGEITASKLDAGYNGWVKIDGTKYETAWIYSGEAIATESEGTFYLYNGYVMHFDGEAGESDETYAYIVREGVENGKWGSKYFVEVVLADGTVAEFEIDEDSTGLEGVVAYEFDDEDEVYNLTAAGEDAGAITLEKGKTAIGEDFSANSKTVYVVIELDDEDDTKFEDATVYTGYKNLKSVEATNAFVVAEEDEAAEIVFVIYGADADAESEDLIYIAGASASDVITDKDLGAYITVNAVVEGKIVEIMLQAEDDNTVDYSDVLFASAKVNNDEVYTALTAAEAEDFVEVAGEFGKAKDEVIKIDGVALAYAEDAVMFVIDTDGEITKGNLGRNYSDKDGEYTINIKYTVNDDDEVTVIFVEKVAVDAE